MSYSQSITRIRWPALALACVATLLVALFALILSDQAPALIEPNAGLAAALWVVALATLVRIGARGTRDPLRPLPALVAGASFLLGLLLLVAPLIEGAVRIAELSSTDLPTQGV